MGEIDFPLFLETVIKETGREKITVMGHSQGATQIFASMAEFPEQQKYIGIFSNNS
jgi:pimeloyl-ACP methyl ester carboxylesterase